MEAVLAEPTIDDGDRTILGFGSLNKIRPNLEFDQDEERRLDALQCIANRPCKVEWKIKDGMPGESFLGDLHSGPRRRRDKQFLLWKTLFKAEYENPKQLDFTDTNGMQPDDGTRIRVQRRKAQQLLLPTCAISLSSDGSVNQPWKGSQQTDSIDGIEKVSHGDSIRRNKSRKRKRRKT
jgi:hypothetical protein